MLLSALHQVPEYDALLHSVQEGKSAAVTGIGQINRSHVLSGLYHHSQRPMVIICQDEMAARRLQEELKGFLDLVPPSLPCRELTLYDSAVVSRAGNKSACVSCMIWLPETHPCRFFPGNLFVSEQCRRRFS